MPYSPRVIGGVATPGSKASWDEQYELGNRQQMATTLPAFTFKEVILHSEHWLPRSVEHAQRGKPMRKISLGSQWWGWLELVSCHMFFWGFWEVSVLFSLGSLKNRRSLPLLAEEVWVFGGTNQHWRQKMHLSFSSSSIDFGRACVAKVVAVKLMPRFGRKLRKLMPPSQCSPQIP